MRRILAITLLLALVLCGCSQTAPTPTPSVNEQLKVHFIDVGQADSILLEFNGHFALVDGGNSADGVEVATYLQLLGVQKLELVVATHPHEDPLSRLRDAEVTVLRTDECETIVARSDGKDIYFMWGNEHIMPNAA